MNLDTLLIIFYDFLRLIWLYSCIFLVWPMITYIYVIRPSSLGFTQQTVSRINAWSVFQCIYTLFSLRYENVTCRTKNVYIRWFEKARLFSYLSNHIVSSFSSTNENAATYHKSVCFEESTSFSRCLWCERNLHKVCDIFFCLIYVVWCMITHFFINVVYWVKTCFLHTNVMQSLVERASLYILLCNICFRKWQRVTLQKR